MISAFSPHGDVVIKRAKDVAAGTYEKPKPAKKAAKKDADAAAAPAPAPLAEKVKDAKDKVAEAVVGRKLLSFADLHPSAGRRLLQQKCGTCEYADKSGACKVAPASLDCDGIVGMSGEWNCGTCQSEFWTFFFFFLKVLNSFFFLRSPLLPSSLTFWKKNTNQPTPTTTSWGTARSSRTARCRLSI